MKKRFSWKPYIIASIISIIIGVLIFCLFFPILKRPAIDGTGYAAIILISSSLLIFIAREGFFDIFAYGFKQLGSQMFGRKPNEYHDYSSYKNYVNTKRETKSRYYIAIAIVGCLFLIATIILSIYTNL